ncbi:DUF6443 domain-containing protein [Epilithonimonas vandammei]|uniref:RHS repeat-associated core domain-containing protein n=2 Tax=Epilithonimonas vandammei TaxID=2487072 RepID=A0A3G8Y722_9FLAO|nr:DUF6443 domain-containing protein [Epilithonimonas vandammei]AZI41162.1 RHS repeat-associated core domain-containing protein [Epilithonimonas vandammei]
MKKHIIPIALLFIAVNSFAQTVPSSTENYVYTKTYLSKPGDPIQKPPLETVQYFDGLGRPKQVVNVKASPAGKDVVTHIEYDGFGRQTKDYLPVPQSGSTNGAIYGNPLANVTSAPYGSEKIYTEKMLESSPLDRIQQQIQVGNAWSNKPVAFGYDANKSTDKVMRFWSNVYWPNQNNNDLRLETAKYFGDNQLYKNTVTDEDGNVSIEFKNGEGQTLLVRKMLTSTQSADTYYVYDEYNRLSFVISPEASQKLDAALAGGSSTLDPATRDIIDNLCYRYKYDGRNRLIEKKLPGKGWEYMVYDKQDRLIFTQDANLASANNAFRAQGWLFTKYDQFGRVVYTGFVASTDGRATVQNVVDTSTTIISNNESRSGTALHYNGINLYYTNNAFPSVITKLLSVNYYDTYPPDLASVPASIQGQAVLPQTGSQSTKSLPTASFVKNLEDDKWTKTYTFYDQKARPVGTWSYNHLGGYTKTESVLDFTGVPQKTMTYHKRLNSSTETVVKEDFVYDHQNRLLEHYHEVVGKSPVVSLAKNTYNEIGQLTKKEVGRSAINPLQTVDYKYNIRGWLTDVNDPASVASMKTDLFAYTIRYNDRVGQANPVTGYTVQPKYNGNIAEIDWNAVDYNGAAPYGAPLRYGYAYDNLNRLLGGFYQDPYNLGKGTNNEIIEEYDLNGNIRKLKRFGRQPRTTAPVKIDDLVYTYTGNQVTRIVDNPTGTANPNGYEGGGGLIEYDANGNMTKMPDKGITAITYNHLNLPKEIAQVNNTKYYYRADGVKIRKAFTLNNSEGSTPTTSEYLDGFQYVTRSAAILQAFKSTDDTTLSAKTAGQEETFVSRIDEAAALPQPQTTMVLSFFPTAEGFYDVENSKYIWQYKDHLGNVRLSYAQDSAGALEIVDRNDFYPFGMNFVGYYSVFDAQGSLYNYKYNGKELQETGMYDYGARMYMPDAVIWGQHDPLSEKYYESTPYAYVLGNPISNYDPDGMQVENDYKLLKNGDVKLIKETNDKSDTLYATDKKGNVDTSKSVTVQKAKASDSSVIGDLATQTTSDKANGFDKINYARTTNSNDAANVYMFAAKNSNVEWGLNAFQVGNKTSYTLFTGHIADLTPSNFQNQSMSKLLFEIHSHKNVNGPSPINGMTNGDYGISRQGDNYYYYRTGGKTTYPGHYLYYAPNEGKSVFWKYHWLNKEIYKKNMGSTIDLKNLK